ncbi:MAG: DUF3656 domain-containing protein [Acutalibacteraceae bacterium]
MSIPVSLLNQLRREALEQLLKQRGQAPVIPFHPVSFPANTLRQSTEPLPLRAVFTRLHSADDIPDCANVCQMIYIPINTKEHIVKNCKTVVYRWQLLCRAVCSEPNVPLLPNWNSS